MLPTLSRIRQISAKRLAGVASHIALVSYSIYLSNGILSQGMSKVNKITGLSWWPLAIFYFAVVWVIGTLSYRYIEKPFIDLYRRKQG